MALIREWTADVVASSSYAENLDALLLDSECPAELMGLLLASLRLDLPAVAVSRKTSTSVALGALGVSPLVGDPAETVVDIARSGGPTPKKLAGTFALANALRAGLSVGAGPELLVHLAALSRESNATGFSHMLRVLTPETPVVAGLDSVWFEKHGTAGLLAYLGDAIHSVPTVTGQLKSALPEAPNDPGEKGARMVFAKGRASGTEAICRVHAESEEISGECRVFGSEEDAVQAASKEDLSSAIIVVGGYGPRGAPGLHRLDRLGEALDEAGIAENAIVMTDGLAPDEAGTGISLVSPEATADGVIGLLRDGDVLKIDLESGRIRTRVSAQELESREPYSGTKPSGYGYAARYARSALPGLEGGGFGLS